MKIKGGAIRFFVTLIFLSGFFYCLKVKANSSNIVINEIAWMGTEISASDEWIELRNLSDEDINLDAWILKARDGSPEINLVGTIRANDFYLLERTDDNSILDKQADLIYSGSIGNTNEILDLIDDNGNIIDTVNIIDDDGDWMFGDNTNKKTAERKNDGTWQTSKETGGSPKEENSEGEVNENNDEDGNDNDNVNNNDDENEEENNDNNFFYNKYDVVINEFVSSPESGKHEWIELFNNTNYEITLDDWIVSDGSGTKTLLEGEIRSGDFFIIDKPKGSLNNSGDEIVLEDPNGDLIDKVAYGDWSSSVEAPAKGYSLARNNDGVSTASVKNDFSLTSILTKGEVNIIENNVDIESNSNNSSTSKKKKEKIIITEIFPNPVGNDKENEFIELYNPGMERINLMGWRLENEKGKLYEFGRFDFLYNEKINNYIKPNGHLILKRPRTNLALSNNGGTIKLFSPSSSKAVQTLKYGKAEEGLSYIDTKHIDRNNIVTSTKIFLLNSLELDSWVWTRRLTPEAKNIIEVINHKPVVDFSFPEEIKEGEMIYFDASDTFDEDEDDISFHWDFGDGIELDLEEPHHTFLKDGDYEVKLVVNDGREESFLKKKIRVINVFDEIIEPINSLDENEIVDFENSGGDNFVVDPIFFDNFDYDLEKEIALGGMKVDLPIEEEITKVSLSEIKNIEKGKELIIMGQVLVLPSVFGTQYLYIVDESKRAFKIYNYKKDFPILENGDLIEVFGELSENRGELCLKTSNLDDINVLEKKELLEAKDISSDEINEDNLNLFVKIKGEIIKKNASKIILDNEGEEIIVYIKSSVKIDKKNIIEGLNMKVRGLIGEYSGDYVIMPRGDYDIVVEGKINEDENKAEKESIELVKDKDLKEEGNIEKKWILPERNKEEEVYKYILVLACFIIFVLSFLLYKKKH